MATTWGVGEYPLMGQRLKPAAQRTVDLARVAPGDRVLDVACGTGNAALMAAARGAAVVGVDLEPALLAVARQRAIELDVGVLWREGDAEALPVEDGAFEVVVSVFGIMYASDQARAAAELARACSPGARVVLAGWTPEGFMSAMGAALAPFLPPVTGSAPPSRWGDAAAVGELLGGAGLTAGDAHTDHVALDFEDRLSAVAFLVRTAGHVVAQRPRLEAEGRWSQLLAALAALVTERSASRDGGVTLRLDYLVATATKS
ncbi:MAG TPA: methyltransferase domain-containing protein [Baekduia sp.]|uniref:class I SAM-dependent methyltransferase n=1 Tax=Baekduia sp. TaxID=2600305 RepID=UPI002C665FB8|nr:methyltransferase domain-containing protein [Baekduia sp.]HMJ36581.1 methyltransferase domain-containing protein [Baekduia sp.]